MSLGGSLDERMTCRQGRLSPNGAVLRLSEQSPAPPPPGNLAGGPKQTKGVIFGGRMMELRSNRLAS